MNLIRLETELENAIGYRDYYLKHDNIIEYNVWDMEVESILEEIKRIGVMQ